MARKEDPKTSTLLVNPDTPEQRASSVMPTGLLPMLGERAVRRERERNGDAELVWVHRTESTTTREAVL